MKQNYFILSLNFRVKNRSHRPLAIIIDERDLHSSRWNHSFVSCSQNISHLLYIHFHLWTPECDSRYRNECKWKRALKLYHKWLHCNRSILLRQRHLRATPTPPELDDVVRAWSQSQRIRMCVRVFCRKSEFPSWSPFLCTSDEIRHQTLLFVLFKHLNNLNKRFTAILAQQPSCLLNNRQISSMTYSPKSVTSHLHCQH